MSKTITLSEDVSQWIEQQATSRQISADEFVSELAREARERARNAGADDNAELERLLLEGINSGPGERVTTEWWAEFRSELSAELKERNNHGASNGTAPA